MMSARHAHAQRPPPPASPTVAILVLVNDLADRLVGRLANRIVVLQRDGGTQNEASGRGESHGSSLRAEPCWHLP